MQSYNRYSYVFNNPMSYTDPSGFISLGDVRNSLRSGLGAIISIGLRVNTTTGWAYTKPVRRAMRENEWLRMAGSAGAAAFAGPDGAALYAAYIADISGGSYSDIGKAAFNSALTSAAFALIAHPMPQTEAFFSVENFSRILVHGAIGGSMSHINGGKFSDGFLSAALSQAFSLADGYKEIFGLSDSPSGVWERFQNGAAAALVGATISWASGGDSQAVQAGALAALYGRMFNDVLITIYNHSMTDSSIAGDVKISSDVTGEVLEGHSVQPMLSGSSGLKNPLGPGFYDAFLRGDGNKIQLLNTGTLTYVQIHVGNNPLIDSEGCFLGGYGLSLNESFNTYQVSNSRNFMNSAANLIQNDGTGNIRVQVYGVYRSPYD